MTRDQQDIDQGGERKPPIEHYVPWWAVQACMAFYFAVKVPESIVTHEGRSSVFYAVVAVFLAWAAWRGRRDLKRHETEADDDARALSKPTPTVTPHQPDHASPRRRA